jgi:hypothetical protein
MSELIALTRCALARHRSVAIVLLALVFVGEAIALVSVELAVGYDRDDVVIAALFCSLMPAGIAAMGIFDFGQEDDLMSPTSGCGQWLLLTPVAPWKIALVPVVLKTAWVSGIWLLFMMTMSGLGSGTSRVVIPWFTPCLCLSGSLIWVLAIAWRPFANGWTRLAALVASLPMLYSTVVFVFMTSQPMHKDWWAVATAWAIVVYVSAVLLTIHAVTLAKTHCMGIVTEAGSDGLQSSKRTHRRRELGGPVRALIWHDVTRTRGFIRYVVVLGVMPTVVAATFFLPLHWGTLSMVSLLFAYFAAIATGGVTGRVNHDVKASLPPYLAASPLDTATIAWTRLASILAIMIPVGGCILLVFAGWAVWEENRSHWYQWAADVTLSSQASGDAVLIGIRCSIAIVLAATVVALGRLVSCLWVGMIGRTWVSAVVGIASGLLLCGLLSVALRWFMQQTDWESTTTSAYHWLGYAPHVVAGLLITKAILVIAATITLWQSRLTTGDRILVAFAVWGAITFSISAVLSVLVPDARITFVSCLAATTLAIPLARILILPVSLSLNRHR